MRLSKDKFELLLCVDLYSTLEAGDLESEERLGRDLHQGKTGA